MNPPAIARSRLLICPVCQLPLEDPDQSGKKLQCGNNHSFDIARQGYIHLLPVQHKKSRSPGDNRAMVQSRQRFLSSGHYEPLANKLGCILQEHLRDTTPLHLLDAGCGEGYYTRYLQAALQQHWPDKTLTVCGIDISKDAIVAACRRSRQITWIVASLKQPPVQPGSFHGLVSIFSPLPDAPMQACLRDDGVLVMITPGNNHLKSLKQQLYDEVLPFDEDKVLTQREPCWDLVSRTKLCYEFTLSSGDLISALLAMTPHTWRIPLEKKQRLGRLTTLHCEADFVITVWRKKSIGKGQNGNTDE